MHIPTPRPPHPVARAAREAAMRLLGIQWHSIYGEADMADAKALIKDLEAIYRIVDPLVLAVGDYASSNFNGVDLTLFERQLEGALEGNATYTLTEAAEAAAEEFEGGQAERRREFQREPV